MTQELATLCGFTNPDKCTNHGTKAYTTTIMSNAAVPIPLTTRLARQSHSKEISAAPYGRENQVSERRLQDGMSAMPTNPDIVALNGTCINPHAPPLPKQNPHIPPLPKQPIPLSPPPPKVTPVQPRKSPIDCTVHSREIEIISLNRQLEIITKEKIALQLKQAGEDDSLSTKKLEIEELQDEVRTYKRKYDVMFTEFTIFKDKEKEELYRKKEEASRDAMTKAMNAIITQNNIAFREELKRDRDAAKICIIM